MSHPPCFDSEDQFDTYMTQHERCVSMVRGSKPNDVARRNEMNHSSFCLDCTKTYQDQMIKESRCQFPGVVFVQRPSKDPADVDVEGVRPSS